MVEPKYKSSIHKMAAEQKAGMGKMQIDMTKRMLSKKIYDSYTCIIEYIKKENSLEKDCLLQFENISSDFYLMCEELLFPVLPVHLDEMKEQVTDKVKLWSESKTLITTSLESIQKRGEDKKEDVEKYITACDEIDNFFNRLIKRIEKEVQTADEVDIQQFINNLKDLLNTIFLNREKKEIPAQNKDPLAFAKKKKIGSSNDTASSEKEDKNFHNKKKIESIYDQVIAMFKEPFFFDYHKTNVTNLLQKVAQDFFVILDQYLSEDRDLWELFKKQHHSCVYIIEQKKSMSIKEALVFIGDKNLKTEITVKTMAAVLDGQKKTIDDAYKKILQMEEENRDMKKLILEFFHPERPAPKQSWTLFFWRYCFFFISDKQLSRTPNWVLKYLVKGERVEKIKDETLKGQMRVRKRRLL